MPCADGEGDATNTPLKGEGVAATVLSPLAGRGEPPNADSEPAGDIDANSALGTPSEEEADGEEKTPPTAE